MQLVQVQVNNDKLKNKWNKLEVGMSYRKLSSHRGPDQRNLLDFVSNNQLSAIQERTKHLDSLKKKFMKGGKQVSPNTPKYTPKRKTPPSAEQVEIAKRLHFERSPSDEENMKTPEKPKESVKEEEKKDIVLNKREQLMLKKIQEMINPVKQGLEDLREEWTKHKEEMEVLVNENQELRRRINIVEKTNSELLNQIKWLEDKQLENRVIVQGIPESTWESEENCKEKIFVAISKLVNRNTYEERLTVARNIPLKNVRRIGRYNPMRTRPVGETFECIGDVEYLLENKCRIERGIYVDKEYGPETEKNRQILRPIFNAARKHPDYKGQCKMEADVLIIQGKCYTTENLFSLPDNINGFQVTSKCDGSTLAFFGELNPFSNFHPTNFEHNGILYHSSKQMIQHMKAVFFQDEEASQQILECKTALECKQMARNITGYDREKWLKSAKDMCEGGIYEKFHQNDSLANLLISTGEQTLVEASWDTDWGIGITLQDNRCLYKQTWYSQGLLGEILEEVRSGLLNSKGGNIPLSEHQAMEAEEDASSEQPGT